MIVTPSWMSDVWAQLPVALVHTLWQGALAVVVLWMVLRRTSAKRPELRYGICLAVLGCVVAGWLVTWAGLVYWEAAGAPTMRGPSAIGGPSASADRTDRTDRSDPSDRLSAAANRQPADHTTLPWRMWLANAWLAGVAVMAVRAMLLVWGAGRLRRTSALCDDDGVQRILDELRHTLGIAGDVALRVSDRIDGPMVMGVLWPVILLPAYVICGVPPEHLRAALAHELAHIRRYDYLVNLVQLLVESLLFFNPAVWWISRQVRIEREACCDALAIQCTGGATGYARALAEFAMRALPPSTALAMSGPQPERTLLDRIRRILMPQDRPALRLPWYSLVAFLVIGTALLAAFGGFSYLGVKLFAEAMSPQERIEEIERLQEPFDDLAGVEDETKVSVSGVLTTEDGSPLPDDLHVAITTRSGVSSVNYRVDLQDGRFSARVRPGHCVTRVQAEGFAMAVAGPMTVGKDVEPREISLVLKRGHEGVVRLVDDTGTSVADADITWQFLMPWGNGDLMFLKEGTIVTDGTGRASISHCWDRPVALQVLASGYQEVRHPDITLSPNDGVRIELARARSVTVNVRSKATGEPVAGAALGVLAAEGSLRYGLSPFSSVLKTVAESDIDGRILFDTIADGTQYWCYVQGPDGGRAVLYEPLTAGQDPVNVEIGPSLTVSGLVKAPPGAGTEMDGSYRLEYDVGVKYARSGHGARRGTEVNLKNGEGEFIIDDLWPGAVQIYGGEERISLNVHEPVTGVVVQLAKDTESPEQPRRTVILRLEGPAGDPSPRGTLRLDYIKNPGDNFYTNVTLPIENGEVRYEVPVPTKISYRMDQTIGYFIKESQEIEVAEGEEPFEVTVPALPAGTIHGTITNPPHSWFSLSVILVESPPERDLFPLKHRAEKDDNAYLFGSLPLGSTYAILATDDAATVLSAPVKLTETAPILEVNLTFAEGIPVEGAVTYPDGAPASGLPVTLHLETKYSHGYGTQPVITGADGEFRFEHVNFDLPVTYAIELKPDKDYMAVRQVVSRGKPVRIQLERGLVLEGRIVEDATGYPVPGVEVYGTSTQPETSIVDADARTDDDGRFRFTRLRDQVYSLGTRDGAQPVRSVEVDAGTGAPVEIRVEIQSWSSLRAVAPEESGGGG